MQRSRPHRFARLNRSLASRICSIGFAVLITLPITEPFQTVSLSELLMSAAHSMALAANATVVAAPRDTAVSVVPPVDQTEGRLKVESRSTAEKWQSPDFHQAIIQSGVVQTQPCADQSTPVLRL
jgi:hypothetical protein